jgi:hypothetical protein
LQLKTIYPLNFSRRRMSRANYLGYSIPGARPTLPEI